MPAPYNYGAQLTAPSFNEYQQAGLDQAYKNQAIQLELQAKQQAMQAAQQRQRALQNFAQLDNPTAQDYAQISRAMPDMAEHFKKSWEILDPTQRDARWSQTVQVYSALDNASTNPGAQDIAVKRLEAQSDAYKNSGMAQRAAELQDLAEVAKVDPVHAKKLAFLSLHSVDPEKATKLFDSVSKSDLQPALVSKGKSEAIKSGVEAGVAQATAPALSEKPGLDNQIAQLDVQIKQADSETKRGQLVLDRDKLIAERGLKTVEKGEGAQAQIDSAQHALDTITSLRADPLMKESAGNWAAGMGTMLGKFLGIVPGTENKDFRGQLESLKSQIFLPAVQQIKGMGALSNAEGEKLTASVVALDADMSPKAFKNALGVVDRYMTKGLQKGLANKAVPVQGGGFVIKHPQYGAVREGDINKLLMQFPGSTREQVLQYLQSTGAK